MVRCKAFLLGWLQSALFVLLSAPFVASTMMDNYVQNPFESLRMEADPSTVTRAGTVDLVPVLQQDPNANSSSNTTATETEQPQEEMVAICHILGLLAASHPPEVPGGKRCDPIHLETKYTEMSAALLAIRHFNEGNGFVAPDLEGINERCPIRFTSEFHDDFHTPSQAVQVLTRIFAERATANTTGRLPMPCTVHGAGWSSVSKPTSVVTGSYGLPQMSYLSTSPELSERWNYPMFSRVVPTDAAAAAAAVRFIGDYCKATHVAVIFINDSYGNEFHRAFREFGLAKYNMQVASIPLAIQPTDEEIASAVASIVTSGYRYVFAIIFEEHYESVMTEAVRQGVAGTGEHFWLLGNNGIKELLQKPTTTYAPGSDLARATEGMAILPEFGGDPVSDGFTRFVEAWKELGAEDAEYFSAKLPMIDDRPGSECYSPPSPSDFFQTTLPQSPAALAYDTVVAMGLGACRAYNYTTQSLDGVDHDMEIVVNTIFEGATGLVDIELASRNPLTFTYVVLNAVAVSDPASGNLTFTTPESVLLEPNTDGTDWIVVTEAPFVFPDGSTTPPPDLPPMEEDMNYIGNLRIIAYVLFTIVAVLSISCTAWTWSNRTVRVVRASQPFFLHLVSVGVLILGSAIIPLSIDDQYFSQRGCDIACMTTPWLSSVGFVTAFSALFSKTWRINQLLQSAAAFRRVKVTEMDVIKPFALLMSANVILLVLWTVLSPLKFERVDDYSDEYGRVVSSHGSCVPDPDGLGGAIPYVVVLAVINLCPVLLANIQAYRARNLHMEYSESRYIAMVNGSLLQAWLTGIPLLVLVRDNPSAFFVVGAIVLFLTSLAILLLIFVPKVDYLRVQKGESTRPNASGGSDSMRDSAAEGLRAKIFRGSALGRSFAGRSSFFSGQDSGSLSFAPGKTSEVRSSGVGDSNIVPAAENLDTVVEAKEGATEHDGLQVTVSPEQQPLKERGDDNNDDDDGLYLSVAQDPVGKDGLLGRA